MGREHRVGTQASHESRKHTLSRLFGVSDRDTAWRGRFGRRREGSPGSELATAEVAVRSVVSIARERNSEPVINGIRPIAVGEHPARFFKKVKPGYVRRIRGDYVSVARGELSIVQRKRQSRPKLDSYDQRGENDYRMASTAVYGDRSSPVPEQVFLLNKALMRQLEAVRAERGEALATRKILAIALGTSDGSVRSEFSPQAINDINASYFASSIAFSEEAHVAPLFIGNRPINRAFGEVIAAAAQDDTVRVKLLSSGTRLDHLHAIVEPIQNGQGRPTELVVTDFIAPTISPDLIFPPHVTVRSEAQSLLEPLSQLPEGEKMDAMIATYSFDSVWMPEDMRVIKKGGKWYQYTYRVKVDDWHPRREELLQAMREGRPLERATPADYEGIFVEDALQEISLADHPFGSYLENAIGEGETVNFPGGLIRTVVEAFDQQVTDSGVFIIGDVTGVTDRSSRVSGVAARYKVEDYQLAKKILEKEYGLHIDTYRLSKFVGKYLGEGWETTATEGEIDQVENITSNKIMIVRRKASETTN